MDQKKIDRINELSRKPKAEGLTDEDNLEHTWIVDEHGNKRKLTPKGTRGRKERK